MRILMVGIGSDWVALDWAKAASRVGEVVGLDVIVGWPMASHQTGSSLSVSHHGGFQTVVAHLMRRLRPKRFMGPINDMLEYRLVTQAVDYAIRTFGSIDLVHTHRYAGALAVAHVAGDKGIPLVHTEHSSALVRGNPYRSPSRTGLRAAALLYKRAAMILFVSNFLRDEAKSRGLMGTSAVVPNPVDDSLFYPGRRSTSPWIRLISVGSLIPGKRHLLMLEAFRLALAAEPRLRLQLIGDGPLRSRCEVVAMEMGISEAVTFPGRMSKPQVAAQLSDSDIYVHSSEVETFGVALIEAQFCGLPVVATDSRGVLNEYSSPGLKVVEDNAEDLAHAVLRVVHNLDAFDRVAIADRARQRFGVEVVAGDLHRVYADVLRGRSR